MFLLARLKNGCPLHIFLFILAVYFALVLNFPLLIKVYVYFKQDTLMSIVTNLSLLMLLLFCLFFSLFSILSVKYLEKTIFIALTLLSSILSYSYFYYNFIFDKSSFFYRNN